MSESKNFRIIYNSDILDSEAQIIVQQCNCTAKKTHGLSATIAKKFPYANFYSERVNDDTPGTIRLAGDSKKKQRFVIAMFAQVYPGKSKKPDDTRENREKWFEMCLNKISKIKRLKSVAFPYKIGCGLAGGNWDTYYKMICKWAESHPEISVEIVSQEQNPSEKNDIDIIKTLDDTEKLKLFTYLLENTNVHNDIISAYKQSTEKGNMEEKKNEEKLISWETTTLKDYCQSYTPEGWGQFFENIITEEGLDDVSDFLKKEAKKHKISPQLTEVFTVFDLCPPEEIKVVIIGQDPYPTPGVAMGIAFGHHSDNTKIQPSLRNIYKALEKDGYRANFENGDLSMWCVQGVFLINTALTVREGDAGSHASKGKDGGIWDYFIGQLFRYISEKCEHLVIIAWGAKAKEYIKYFDSDECFVITAPHPAASTYNPSNTEFIDHKPFSRANKQLKKWGMDEIDWNIDE